MGSKVQRVKKNIVWSLLKNVIGILLPFVTQSFLIAFLGMEYVGLNGLFTSVLGILNLAELGFGSALVFSMYKPIAYNDVEKVCALLSYYRKCYQKIGLIILIMGLGIMPFIKHFISGDVPDNINVYILFGIYLINTVLTYFMYSYKTSLLTACQRVDIISILDLVISIGKTVIQCLAIYFMRDYFAFALLIPVSTIIRNLLGEYITRKKYPQFICKGEIDSNQVYEIKQKVNGLICQKIGNALLFSSDGIFVSAFLGLTIAGIYNNYMYIYNAIVYFVGVISSSLTPVIGNCIATISKEKNYKRFCQLQIILLWFVSWCAITELCLLQPFMHIWVGESKMFSGKIVILFVLYFYVIYMGNIAGIYKEATGIWKEGKYVYLANAVVNIILDYILVKVMGISGILLATILSVLCIANPFGAKVLFDHYFNQRGAFLKYLLTQFVHGLFTVLIGGITYYLCELIGVSGIIGLIIRVFICLFVPNIIFLIIYLRNKSMQGIGILIKEVIHKHE